MDNPNDSKVQLIVKGFKISGQILMYGFSVLQNMDKGTLVKE